MNSMTPAQAAALLVSRGSGFVDEILTHHEACESAFQRAMQSTDNANTLDALNLAADILERHHRIAIIDGRLPIPA